MHDGGSHTSDHTGLQTSARGRLTPPSACADRHVDHRQCGRDAQGHGPFNGISELIIGHDVGIFQHRGVENVQGRQNSPDDQPVV
jgi:hypothetical protein